MSLSSDQTEKVLQFQDLTGIENVTVCRDVLIRHGWNLESAVQDQLNIREGRPTVFASDSGPPAVINDPSRQHVFFSPPSNSPARWGGPFGAIISHLYNLCFDKLLSLTNFILSLFWTDPRKQVTDPLGDVMRFINYFEKTFGQSHPVFYQGTYSQALSDAKQELRFLIVYLHSDNNADCNTFCRTTLSNEDVISYINHSNMLFWAVNVSSGEGYRVCHALQGSTYPYIAVIMLRDSKMTLIGRLEGPMESDELIRQLQSIVSANEACLVAERADRMERSFNQTLRAQQDEAFLESLRADQEKERQRRRESQRKEEEERHQRQLEEEERCRREELKRKKLELRSQVPDEPAPSHPEAVSIVFKLPSGDRLERRFLISHTLKDIYHFVFCHPDSPDSLEIATNFPKKILNIEEDAATTLESAGLKKREVLFVYDLEA